MFDLTKLYVFDGGENAGGMVGQNKWKDLHVNFLEAMITNMEDRRHWNWFPTEESRFHVVAYCQQCVVNCLFSDGQHAVSECFLDDIGQERPKWEYQAWELD
ncbi:hypothetical protein HAX54_051048 [Datura stramonium]|uniref:Uncharacterized protein n=1 Tax=Datura stramonium TaxID=4076 RepID=A0ABS8RST3_DATST|nr:hypothetical protein [Datura stramonium]